MAFKQEQPINCPVCGQAMQVGFVHTPFSALAFLFNFTSSRALAFRATDQRTESDIKLPLRRKLPAQRCGSCAAVLLRF